jgi:hypothetical protein
MLSIPFVNLLSLQYFFMAAHGRNGSCGVEENITGLKEVKEPRSQNVYWISHRKRRCHQNQVGVYESESSTSDRKGQLPVLMLRSEASEQQSLARAAEKMARYLPERQASSQLYSLGNVEWECQVEATTPDVSGIAIAEGMESGVREKAFSSPEGKICCVSQ